MFVVMEVKVERFYLEVHVIKQLLHLALQVEITQEWISKDHSQFDSQYNLVSKNENEAYHLNEAESLERNTHHVVIL